MHKLGAPEGISLIYRASLVNAFNEMATLVDQRVLPVVELIIQPPPLRPQLIQHRQLTSDIHTISSIFNFFSRCTNLRKVSSSDQATQIMCKVKHFQ